MKILNLIFLISILSLSTNKREYLLFMDALYPASILLAVGFFAIACPEKKKKEKLAYRDCVTHQKQVSKSFRCIVPTSTKFAK